MRVLLHLFLLACVVSTCRAAYVRGRMQAYCSTTGAAVTVSTQSATVTDFVRSNVQLLTTNFYFVDLDITFIDNGIVTDEGVKVSILIGSDLAINVVYVTETQSTLGFVFQDATTSNEIAAGAVVSVTGGSCTLLSTHSIAECFPDDALVTLLSGEERRMDQLQIGDEVRCLKGNQVNLCTVTTFTDREVGTPHLYYSLVHAQGALELSRRHMVYVVPANLTATCRPLEIEDATLSPLPHADSCYTYAERVRVGDRIAVFSKDASVMTLEPIMAVERVVKAGKITPLTNGGARIIVNNVLTTSISDAPAGEASSALFLLPLTQSLDTRRAEDISGIHPFCKPFVTSVPLLKEAYEAGIGNEINVAHALKRASASGEAIEFADISAYSLLHQNLGLPVDSTVAWLLKPALRILFAALEWGVGRDAMIESMNARLLAALQVMKKNSQ